MYPVQCHHTCGCKSGTIGRFFAKEYDFSRHLVPRLHTKCHLEHNSSCPGRPDMLVKIQGEKQQAAANPKRKAKEQAGPANVKRANVHSAPASQSAEDDEDEDSASIPGSRPDTSTPGRAHSAGSGSAGILSPPAARRTRTPVSSPSIKTSLGAVPAPRISSQPQSASLWDGAARPPHVALVELDRSTMRSVRNVLDGLEQAVLRHPLLQVSNAPADANVAEGAAPAAAAASSLAAGNSAYADVVAQRLCVVDDQFELAQNRMPSNFGALQRHNAELTEALRMQPTRLDPGLELLTTLLNKHGRASHKSGKMAMLIVTCPLEDIVEARSLLDKDEAPPCLSVMPALSCIGAHQHPWRLSTATICHEGITEWTIVDVGSEQNRRLFRGILLEKLSLSQRTEFVLGGEEAFTELLLASRCFTPTRGQLDAAGVEYSCARLEPNRALVRDGSVIAFCASDSSIPVVLEHTYFADHHWYDQLPQLLESARSFQHAVQTMRSLKPDSLACAQQPVGATHVLETIRRWSPHLAIPFFVRCVEEISGLFLAGDITNERYTAADQLTPSTTVGWTTNLHQLLGIFVDHSATGLLVQAEGWLTALSQWQETNKMNPSWYTFSAANFSPLLAKWRNAAAAASMYAPLPDSSAALFTLLDFPAPPPLPAPPLPFHAWQNRPPCASSSSYTLHHGAGSFSQSSMASLSEASSHSSSSGSGSLGTESLGSPEKLHPQQAHQITSSVFALSPVNPPAPEYYALRGNAQMECHLRSPQHHVSPSQGQPLTPLPHILPTPQATPTTSASPSSSLNVLTPGSLTGSSKTLQFTSTSPHHHWGGLGHQLDSLHNVNASIARHCS